MFFFNLLEATNKVSTLSSQKGPWVPRAESWVKTGSSQPPLKSREEFTFPRETFPRWLVWWWWCIPGTIKTDLLFGEAPGRTSQHLKCINRAWSLRRAGRLWPPVVVWQSAICGGKWITINLSFWYCRVARWDSTGEIKIRIESSINFKTMSFIILTKF